MSSPTYLDIWKRLSQVSFAFLNTATPPSKAPVSVQDPNKRPPPTLTLTVPEDFTDFIYKLQLPPSTVRLSLARIHKAVDEQKALHQQKYLDICDKVLHLNVPSTSSNHMSCFSALKTTHESSFQRQLSRIKQGFLDTLEQVRATSSPKKAVFNPEYVPFLEQYFEYNAFPSARDRELLARKSSMTPRQIEVWFQNHRRRARNDGVELRRITSHPLPATLSLDTLEKQMPLFIIPEKDRRSASVDEFVKWTSESAANRPLSPPSTPKRLLDDVLLPVPTTFPAIYHPPVPTSEKSLFQSPRRPFPAPVWHRTPRPYRKPSPYPSVDDICLDFGSKLHMGGGSLRKQSRYRGLGRYSATCHRPMPAPLPALRPTYPLPAPPPSLVSSQTSTSFGRSGPLRSRIRHRPYDAASRKYPTWTIPGDRPVRAGPQSRSPIPRIPSCSSISSIDSWSDPPTPADSPSPFIDHLFPADSDTPAFTIDNTSHSKSNMHPPVRASHPKPQLYPQSNHPTLSFLRVVS
ncbi:homeodomain mating-type protein [Ephemerocybe angulata]|uniref:Homeodomain mating-type protein n=1 Tax=Ephemerocybe angulata TaxID=980116 RepID=A0A8H6H6D1_9AGAR|nr:homeodomain mating-type protein [Tulosesus angulatus]